jgi:hypothetical protein
MEAQPSQAHSVRPAHIPAHLVVDYDAFGDRRFIQTCDLHRGLERPGNARLELRVFFEEWFAPMPTVWPDRGDPPTYRPCLNLSKCKLPLVWG